MNSASPILSKLRSYARTLKVWGHPSTELKSEKREIERHEVKPQDTIPGPMKFSLGQRPSAGLKSEKQEIERYEIKPQDAIPGPMKSSGQRPSAGWRSEKQENERYEVKPQDTIPGPMKFSSGQRPSAGLRSERQEIERYEVKPQDTISGPMKFSLGQQRALDSEQSLSQSSFKFPDDNTDKYVPLNPRSSTSSSIIYLIKRKNVSLLDETVCPLRFIS